ncbi:MAG: T9SS type A sorting domain-containing protein [Bacteroidia bacterium]
MKKYIGLITIFIALIISANAQNNDWEILYQNEDLNLNAIEFTDLRTGYAIGDDGVILKTDNKGYSWQNIGDEAMGSLKFIKALNKDTIFVAGSNTIYRTFDAGNNWELVRNKPEEEYLNLEIFTYVDEVKHRYALQVSGKSGLLLRSINHGNWFSTITAHKFHREKDFLMCFHSHFDNPLVKDTVIYYQFSGTDTLHGTRDNFETLLDVKFQNKDGVGLSGENGVKSCKTVRGNLDQWSPKVLFITGNNTVKIENGSGLSSFKTFYPPESAVLNDAEFVQLSGPDLSKLIDTISTFILGCGENGGIYEVSGVNPDVFIFASDQMVRQEGLPNVNFKGICAGFDEENFWDFHFTACGEGTIVQKRFNNVVLVPGRRASEFKAQVYPNPSEGLATLDISTKESGSYQISIYSVSGVELMQVNKDLPQNHNYKLPLLQLDKGAYLIKVEHNGVKQILRYFVH